MSGYLRNETLKMKRNIGSILTTKLKSTQTQLLNVQKKMGGASTQNILKDVQAPTVMCVWARIVYSSSFPSRTYRPNGKKNRKESGEWKCGSDSLDNLVDAGTVAHTYRKMKMLAWLGGLHLGSQILKDSRSEKSGGKRWGTEETGPGHTPRAGHWILPKTPRRRLVAFPTEPRQTLESFSTQWAVQATCLSKASCPQNKTSLPSGASTGKKDKITH